MGSRCRPLQSIKQSPVVHWGLPALLPCCCHSESITTMATLHDALLAAATAARQRVTLRFKVHTSALQHCCGLLWPRLEVQRRMARRRRLATALQVSKAGANGTCGTVMFVQSSFPACLPTCSCGCACALLCCAGAAGAGRR